MTGLMRGSRQASRSAVQLTESQSSTLRWGKIRLPQVLLVLRTNGDIKVQLLPAMWSLYNTALSHYTYPVHLHPQHACRITTMKRILLLCSTYLLWIVKGNDPFA